MKKLRLGDILIQAEIITDEQLGKALEAQKVLGEKRRLGELLVSLGFVTEDEVLGVIAKKAGIEYINFKDQEVKTDSVKRLPQSIAVKYNIIAYKEEGGTLYVATSDPLNLYAIEDVKLIAGMPVIVAACKKEEIDKAVSSHYADILSRAAADSLHKNAKPEDEMLLEDLSSNDNQAPVVGMVNSIILKGYNAAASDIHFEPYEHNTKIRMRVDGQLFEHVTVPVAMHQGIIARIKIMSNLDIAEKRLPQDGHFRARLGKQEINMRVSVVPTVHGEKAVLRLLSQNSKMDNEEMFLMNEENYKKTLEVLQSPHGIIYITGPTGSGKTTTLYKVLERMAKSPVNISTIEDPVEKNIDNINQTQVNVQAGMNFDEGLRALLRQDPDIIMVGETRDNITAEIAVRAALTGHLVLSTLHTNDSISAINRLLDMDVEHYMIANSLVAVIAQRLVKKICTNCEITYEITEGERKLFGERGAQLKYLKKGAGCHVCNNTGYSGRTAIHEVLSIDSTIRGLISRKAPIEDVYEYLEKTGKLKSLRSCLEELVLQGVTTVQEMLKITYFIE